MAMDMFIAEYFGNIKTASANQTEPTDPSEQEKLAQMELFEKLAAAENIDLEKLSEEQVAHLWNATFDKTASEETEEKKKEEKAKESGGDAAEAMAEKKEEAKKEHEEKKEAMAKIAEAETLGKIMAHSLVAELREISKVAAAAEAAPAEVPVEGAKEAAMPPHLAAALGKGKELAGKAGKAVAGAAGAAKEHGGKALEAAKKHKGTAAAAGAGAAVGGAAGYAAGRKKEGSAIDDLALEEAIKLAEAAGWNAEEAAGRVLGVYNLELLGESTKVASAPDADTAVNWRALEFLEAAGYPGVTWES